MLSFRSILVLGGLSIAYAAPATTIGGYPAQRPVPGISNYYSDYRGVGVPYPGNESSVQLNTTYGPPGPDDQLFQNLLAAEWAIFEFYQQGVEPFNQTDFTAIGLGNTTYDRIQEIRGNEAGHLAIFMNEISSNSIKPGACQYQFGLTSAEAFIITLTLLEIASMAFITGLAQMASTPATIGALAAIGETESRHNTWAMMGIWGVDPFG